MGNRKLISLITAIVLLMSIVCLGNSSILSSDSNQFGVCIRNCAQCKKMFGNYFEGQLCADACVKFKGKIIPDCEDLDSISPFLNKIRLITCRKVKMAGIEDSQFTTGEVKLEKGNTDDETPEALAEEEEGIDVSHWQGKINWSVVAKESKVKHVFIKMTEGANIADGNFVTNWEGAKEAGIRVNCYHYFIALGPDPQKQKQFIREQKNNIMKNIMAVRFNPKESYLAIDVEEKSNDKATPQQMGTNLKKLLDLIKEEPGMRGYRVMIYTSPGYWKNKVDCTGHNFEAYPLWVAHYGVSQPTVPSPWKNWTWWQYSQTGTVKGISKYVDLDKVKKQ